MRAEASAGTIGSTNDGLPEPRIRPPMKKIGLLHIDRDSVFVGVPPSGKSLRLWFGVHVDHPWSECVRDYGSPHRAYVMLGPLGSLIVGLPTNDAEDGWGLTQSQAWTPRQGYRSGRWSAFAYHPDRWMQCPHPVGPPGVARFGPRKGQPTRPPTCGAFRWHRGPCVRPGHLG